MLNYIGDRIGRLRVIGITVLHPDSDVAQGKELAVSNTLLSADNLSTTQGQIVYTMKTDRVLTDGTAVETGDSLYFIVNSDGFILAQSDYRMGTSGTTDYFNELHPDFAGSYGGIVGRLINNPTTHGSYTGEHCFYSADGQIRVVNSDFVEVGEFIGTGVLANTFWNGASCDESVSGHTTEEICTKYGQQDHSTYSVGSSGIWMGYIKKGYLSDSVSADEWFVYPQQIQTPKLTSEGGTSNIVYGEGPDGFTTEPSFGQIKLETIYDQKGEGSLLLVGRKFYATYTYDGTQETLPSKAIEVIGSFPEVSDTVNQSGGIDYDATTILLDDGSEFPTEGGQIEVQDEEGHTQVLDYGSRVDDTLSGISGWYGNGGRKETYSTTSQSLSTNNEDHTTIVTTATHELDIGDQVTITGTTNYNGQWVVMSVPNSTSFDIARDCDEDDDGIIDTGFNNQSGTITFGEDKHNIADGTPVKLVRKDGDLSIKLILHAERYSSTDVFNPLIGGNRITHVNIYTNRFDSTHGRLIEEDFAHVATFDLSSGYTKADNVIEGWAQVGGSGNVYKCQTESFTQPFATSYQMRTGVDPKTRSIEARMKTAVIANRRCYAGNIRMKDENGTVRTYSDRMVKSPPNAFDVFPTGEYIDVAIKDGEDIVKLEEFNSKILQFKEETLYVISIAQDYEFLEQTYRFKGIEQECSAYRTDIGVAFCNEYGAYFYDGQGVESLTQNKIGDWDTYYKVGTTVGYDPKKSQIHFVFPKTQQTSTGVGSLVYDIPTKAWAKAGVERFTNAGDDVRTAFFEYDRKLMYGVLDTGVTNNMQFYNWESTPTSSSTGASSWKTKNMDMAALNVDKRFYHVRLSYKGNSSSPQGVKARIWVDGTSHDLNSGNALPAASDWTTVKLYIGTESSYTIQEGKEFSFELYSEAGETPSKLFKVNDVVIVTRTKQVIK
jgi:hypothetical protein